MAAAYLLALYLQFSRKLYETTVFPLVMLVSGAMNHALILVSRWSFLVEDYGMSSRYALQFQVGVVGILLTLALCWKECQKAGRQVIWRGAAVLVTAIYV